MLDRVKAAEMLELAQIIQSAVAAGVGQVTPVPKEGRRAVQKAMDQYNRMVRGLQARATGTAGDQFDSQGRKIIRSMAELAQFVSKANNPNPKQER